MAHYLLKKRIIQQMRMNQQAGEDTASPSRRISLLPTPVTRPPSEAPSVTAVAASASLARGGATCTVTSASTAATPNDDDDAAASGLRPQSPRSPGLRQGPRGLAGGAETSDTRHLRAALQNIKADVGTDDRTSSGIVTSSCVTDSLRYSVRAALPDKPATAGNSRLPLGAALKDKPAVAADSRLFLDTQHHAQRSVPPAYCAFPPCCHSSEQVMPLDFSLPLSSAAATDTAPAPPSSSLPFPVANTTNTPHYSTGTHPEAVTPADQEPVTPKLDEYRKRQLIDRIVEAVQLSADPASNINTYNFNFTILNSVFQDSEKVAALLEQLKADSEPRSSGKASSVWEALTPERGPGNDCLPPLAREGHSDPQRRHTRIPCVPNGISMVQKSQVQDADSQRFSAGYPVAAGNGGRAFLSSSASYCLDEVEKKTEEENAYRDKLGLSLNTVPACLRGRGTSLRVTSGREPLEGQESVMDGRSLEAFLDGRSPDVARRRHAVTASPPEVPEGSVARATKRSEYEFVDLARVNHSGCPLQQQQQQQQHRLQQQLQHQELQSHKSSERRLRYQSPGGLTSAHPYDPHPVSHPAEQEKYRASRCPQAQYQSPSKGEYVGNQLRYRGDRGDYQDVPMATAPPAASGASSLAGGGRPRVIPWGDQAGYLQESLHPPRDQSVSIGILMYADRPVNSHASASHAPSTHTHSSHAPISHTPSSHAPSTHTHSSHAPISHTPSSHAPSYNAPSAYDPRNHAYSDTPSVTLAPSNYTPSYQVPDSDTPNSHASNSHAPNSYTPNSHAPSSHAPNSYTPNSHARNSHAPLNQALISSHATSSLGGYSNTALTATSMSLASGRPLGSEHSPNTRAMIERSPKAQALTGSSPNAHALSSPSHRAASSHSSGYDIRNGDSNHTMTGTSPNNQAMDGHDPNNQAMDGHGTNNQARGGHDPNARTGNDHSSHCEMSCHTANSSQVTSDHMPTKGAFRGHMASIHGNDGSLSHGNGVSATHGTAPHANMSDNLTLSPVAESLSVSPHGHTPLVSPQSGIYTPTGSTQHSLGSSDTHASQAGTPGRSPGPLGQTGDHPSPVKRRRGNGQADGGGGGDGFVCPLTTSGRNKGSGKSKDPRFSCQICGDVAAGFHCGAYVCEACKKFYLRCLKNGSGSLTCPKQQGCDINKENRSHCQYCRYRKCVTLGMYRPGREDDKKLKVDFHTIPCKVCEAPSSGFHFGAITCEGCKGFFRRMLKEKLYQKFTCSSGGSCMVTSANRTACKACRFNKCLQNGMMLEGTRLGRQSNAIKRTTLIQYKIKHLDNDKGRVGVEVEVKPEPRDDGTYGVIGTGDLSQIDCSVNSECPDRQLQLVEDMIQASKGVDGFDGSPPLVKPLVGDGCVPPPPPLPHTLKVEGKGENGFTGSLQAMQQREKEIFIRMSGKGHRSPRDWQRDISVSETVEASGWSRSPAPHNHGVPPSAIPAGNRAANMSGDHIDFLPDTGVGTGSSPPPPPVRDHKQRSAASDSNSFDDYHDKDGWACLASDSRVGRSSTSTHPDGAFSRSLTGDLRSNSQVWERSGTLEGYDDRITSKISDFIAQMVTNEVGAVSTSTPGDNLPSGSAPTPDSGVANGNATGVASASDSESVCCSGGLESVLGSAVKAYESATNNPSDSHEPSEPNSRWGLPPAIQEIFNTPRLLHARVKNALQQLNAVLTRPAEMESYKVDEDDLASVWHLAFMSFSHNALHILRFVKHLPGFRLVDIDDQMLLVKTSVYPISLIYYSQFYDMERGPTTFMSNTPFERELFMTRFPVFQRLGSHFNIMRRMKAMDMDELEIGFLCALMAFVSSDALGLVQPSRVMALQEEFTASFLEYTDAKDPNRGVFLLARLPELQRSSLEHNDIAILAQQEHPDVNFGQLWQELYLSYATN